MTQVSVTVHHIELRDASVAVLTATRADGSPCYVAVDVTAAAPILAAVAAGQSPTVTVTPWQLLAP